MLPGFCSTGHMILKKKLFEDFQDGYLMQCHFFISEWNDLSNSGSPFSFIFCSRGYGLEENIV